MLGGWCHGWVPWVGARCVGHRDQSTPLPSLRFVSICSMLPPEIRKVKRRSWAGLGLGWGLGLGSGSGSGSGLGLGLGPGLDQEGESWPGLEGEARRSSARGEAAYSAYAASTTSHLSEARLALVSSRPAWDAVR